MVSMTELRGKELERFIAKIDTSGTCWEWRGALNRKGYGMAAINRRTRMAHRLAFEVFNETTIPKGLQIDHTCHNPSCVRPDHLRAVTPKQNAEHRQGATSRSKSGILGVSLNAQTGRWIGQVMHNGRRYYVGSFADIADAESAVISKRNLLFTHNEMDRK